LGGTAQLGYLPHLSFCLDPSQQIDSPLYFG
jgi:hypothetical protein